MVAFCAKWFCTPFGDLTRCFAGFPDCWQVIRSILAAAENYFFWIRAIAIISFAFSELPEMVSLTSFFA